MQTRSIIECIDLSKAYTRRTTALSDLNLNIGEGMSFGLLGENGAGKSTLVKLIMGFIIKQQPWRGRAGVEHHAHSAHSPANLLQHGRDGNHWLVGPRRAAVHGRLRGRIDGAGAVLDAQA